MIMEKVKQFFGDVHTPVAFATVENDGPKVRFFSFKMYQADRIYFITSKQKQVYQQLSRNPKVEICSLPNDRQEWVRLTGEVQFEQNLELNQKAFELLPLLEKAYGTPDNPEIALFYINNPQAQLHSMGKQPLKIEC